MSEIKGAHLHITGIVQGVGFRPFIFGLAGRYGLNGWVRNTSAGVDIEVDGGAGAISQFAESIRNELPPLARIDSFEITHGASHGFTQFEIIPSEVVHGAFQPISPDVSTCADCLDDLFDPSNRRYLYPFTNCTNCGPRFTIIIDIPYDRPNTTMATFDMCPDCRKEYDDPLDRRFHAQPVACPVCGPHVWLEDTQGRQMAGPAEAILMAQKMLAEGRILAIKGLGGFHLACDATNATAVAELRRRKLRVDKPFALMLADMEAVRRYCSVTPLDDQLLNSYQRPIVLLEAWPDSRLPAEIAPGQHTLGVMLPYTPLHYLLFHPYTPDSVGRTPRALVMTSGNLSEEPIASKNDDARLRLAPLADAFLLHDRDIRIRCDDSVVRVADESAGTGVTIGKEAWKEKVYFLRRSRGYAPDPIPLPFECPSILAVGPELKNTFCLTRDQYAFMSHHIGDMENYETFRSFEDGVAHFERLFRIKPSAIAYDLHPNYLSTRYALQRIQAEGIPGVAVQHHHAHIASGMADNGLDGSHPVIGLAFDGTGYGTDGAIWGGEVLLADYKEFQRLAHLAYFPLPGGDAAIRRPARTALALLWSLGLEWEEGLAPVENLCFEERQALRIQLERGLNTVQTSSLGRLFDAVAALAGGRQKVNYEAQAAIEFEAALDPDEPGEYPFAVQDGLIHADECIRAVIADVQQGIPLPKISARFHRGLAECCRQVCDKVRRETGIAEVVLGGGIWQNTVLLREATRRLEKDGFIIYRHHQIPTNDGGLSLGQALVGVVNISK